MNNRLELANLFHFRGKTKLLYTIRNHSELICLIWKYLSEEFKKYTNEKNGLFELCEGYKTKIISSTIETVRNLHINYHEKMKQQVEDLNQKRKTK